MLNHLRFQFWRLRDTLKDRLLGSAHRERIFNRIHGANAWGDSESRSGGGSNLEATAHIRRELPRLLRELNVRVLLDAPCGDFHWMKDVADSLDVYHGVDIVPDLITLTAARFGASRRRFHVADITTDRLPDADAILCRDCFIHLPTRLIRRTLNNFKSTGAGYLLLTDDDSVHSYHDIPVGSFRPINFRKPPFSFPRPLRSLRDGDRLMNVWRLQDLP